MAQASPGVRNEYLRAAGTEMLWVFGLSILHNVALFLYGIGMMLALGTQVLLNNHLVGAANAAGVRVNVAVAIALDAAIAAPLLIAGLAARQGIGVLVLPVLGLYVIDTLVVGWLVTQYPRDLMLMLMLAFHGYMTYSIYTRWNAWRQSAPRTAPGGAGVVDDVESGVDPSFRE